MHLLRYLSERHIQTKMAEVFIQACHRRVMNIARRLHENDTSTAHLESSYTQLTAILRNLRRVSEETPDADRMAQIVEVILKSIDDHKR